MELVLPMYIVSLFFPQKVGQKNIHCTQQNTIYTINFFKHGYMKNNYQIHRYTKVCVYIHI